MFALFNARRPKAPVWLAAAAAMAAAAHAQAALPAPSHIVVVMEENTDYTQVVGDTTDAPYINNTLMNGGLVFASSHGVEHPSQPNYLDFFSGGNQGINDANATATNPLNFGPSANYGGDAYPSAADFNPAPSLPFTSQNLGSELIAAGKTFGEYTENLPTLANGQPDVASINAAASSNGVQHIYARRHDPAINWLSTSPTGGQLPLSVEHDFSQFGASGTDFSNLPNVSLIIPNTIDDMHDGTSVTSRLQAGDTWLKNNMSNYLTWAKTHNSLLIVTWDENDFTLADNRVLTVMNGDPSLFKAGTSYQDVNHYNFLRTIEDVNGAGFAGASANAADIASVNGQFVATPEPPALIMLLMGAGLVLTGRRRFGLLRRA